MAAARAIRRIRNGRFAEAWVFGGLPVVGATSVLRRARTGDAQQASWLHALLERKPARVVTVAIANKTARTAWALLSHEDVYWRAAT